MPVSEEFWVPPYYMEEACWTSITPRAHACISVMLFIQFSRGVVDSVKHKKSGEAFSW